MLLADGNSGSFNELVVTPISVGDTSPVETIPTMAIEATNEPGKMVSGVISWPWIVLTVIVIVAAGWLIFKKVLKK